VLLPSDTHTKPITSITAVLLPFVTYLLTLSRIRLDGVKSQEMYLHATSWVDGFKTEPVTSTEMFFNLFLVLR
jgi:hypothetical protein